MLKNKKAIYILFPLNIAIWGFLIYRIFSSFADPETPIVHAGNQITKTQAPENTAVYELKLDYKDPFLKGESRIRTGTKSNDNSIQMKVKQPTNITTVPRKILPDIKYLGLIKNNTSGYSAALVSINGQSHLIKINEKVDGILCKSYNKDSLVAKWGSERIVARK